MFETSQQEGSSGSGKIVGLVIAVVAVILVVVYFAFLRGQPPAATATGADTGAATAAASGEKPDAARDLTILNPNLHRDPTQTMAMWNFVVSNHSKTIGYKNIRYSTNYYDASDKLIYHNEAALPDAVDPNDEHTFENINDGLYPVGTARYTIEIKGADPVK